MGAVFYVWGPAVDAPPWDDLTTLASHAADSLAPPGSGCCPPAWVPLEGPQASTGLVDLTLQPGERVALATTSGAKCWLEGPGQHLEISPVGPAVIRGSVPWTSTRRLNACPTAHSYRLRCDGVVDGLWVVRDVISQRRARALLADGTGPVTEDTASGPSSWALPVVPVVPPVTGLPSPADVLTASIEACIRDCFGPGFTHPFLGLDVLRVDDCVAPVPPRWADDVVPPVGEADPGPPPHPSCATRQPRTPELRGCGADGGRSGAPRSRCP